MFSSSSVIVNLTVPVPAAFVFPDAPRTLILLQFTGRLTNSVMSLQMQWVARLSVPNCVGSSGSDLNSAFMGYNSVGRDRLVLSIYCSYLFACVCIS